MQHPLEVGHAKGSAPLLQRSLENCRVAVGETFEPQQLVDTDRTHSVLLYPQTPNDCLAPAPALDTNWLRTPSQLRLIVLDATWRKSRKMLYCNPALQQLPRLSLRDVPPSRYRIRKAHQADQLSTLEATCAALAQLENCAQRYAPLLKAFEGFVEQQVLLVASYSDCIESDG